MCNDEVRWKTKQPHLPAIVQARHFFMFDHIAQMPDETHSKKILTASSLENWRRPPGHPRTPLYYVDEDYRTRPTTSPGMKQSTWLRIVCSEDWCLRLVLCTPSGACQKWTNKWMTWEVYLPPTVGGILQRRHVLTRQYWLFQPETLTLLRTWLQDVVLWSNWTRLHTVMTYNSITKSTTNTLSSHSDTMTQLSLWAQGNS